MIGSGSIYDYDSIRRALRRGEAEPELEVRHFNGPNWNPNHLRPQAARLYQVIRQPVTWCDNPVRFGWGEPGLTWWCTSILAHTSHWDFPVVDGRSLGPVKLPSSWRLSRGRDEPRSYEDFVSFEGALAALAGRG